MKLATGFRTVASGSTVYFVDGVAHATEACSWLVERPTFHPEPDFPSDLYRVEDCGAPAYVDTEGRFVCEHGHSRGTLEEELGPLGNEWQREQYDRAGVSA
jgi:hypothetical protein